MKTSELTGAALDWAVAKCWYSDRRVELTQGKTGVRVLRDPTYDGSEYSHWFVFFGSTDWAQGGPIIERESISISRNLSNDEVSPNVFHLNQTDWCAQADYSALLLRYSYSATGPTALIAAMRCYVASKLGDEVEILFELTN